MSWLATFTALTGVGGGGVSADSAGEVRIDEKRQASDHDPRRNWAGLSAQLVNQVSDFRQAKRHGGRDADQVRLACRNGFDQAIGRRLPRKYVSQPANSEKVADHAHTQLM